MIFLNAGEGQQWFPDRVAKRLPEPLHFATVWVVTLQPREGDEYVYGVTRMEPSEEASPIWRVRIGNNFDAWQVEEIILVIGLSGAT